ncbi:heat shock transcription factor, X-linked member 3-like [Pipistrellus kuhlii]|uniref:heat shock transcription factor, X-linked member 3-like n=1 Tax=Pipistrellus kuhlii TaxID=59472 RepID=UPI00174EE175|nr:heat shock transcription factor, X-linked member 3-like [Pipistrellus kuhlii]
MQEARLAPSEKGQPPILVQYDTSPGPHVGPRVALERHSSQEERQDPSPQDNPQPQATNQRATNVEGNNILYGLSFPRKLWRIMEDDAFQSVCWNEDGDTVIIKANLFQREVLCRRGKEQIFESNSLKSFIRLMNLHGFSKIRPDDSSVCSPRNKIMIYQNRNFQRDKPWHLLNIKAKGDQMARVCSGTSASPAKRKKKMAPTRRSPRLYQEESKKEAEQKAQETDKNEWGSSATQAFEFSAPQPLSSIREVQCPSAASGSSGEDTSGNFMFVPTATAGTDGTGDLFPTLPNKPSQGSVMSLYNICYSVLIAELLDLAPPEDLDQAEEEDHEGSSDNKYSLCEQFKDSTVP